MISIALPSTNSDFDTTIQQQYIVFLEGLRARMDECTALPNKDKEKICDEVDCLLKEQLQTIN